MPRNRLPAALLGVCVTALILAPTTPASAHRPHHADGGSLILVGGGLSDDNAAIYGDIVRLAGGAGHARIGIVTAASSTPAEDPDAGTPDCNNSVCNGDYYAALFERYGAHAEWIPIDLDHVSAADDPAVVAQVRGLTGFFFGGGDQYRYVSTMRRAGGTDSAVLAAIRDRLNTGAVVAGSSAGAQIQAGADMLTGGDSYEGLRDGSTPGYFDDASVLGYLPEGGFGFFRAGLLDTHFSTRGRQGRSIRLAADTGHDRVFGLDQDTALEVTGVGTGREAMRVLGVSGVHVLDLRSAHVGASTTGWAIRDVRWTRLTAGDTYDAARWRLSTGKARTRGTGTCQVTPSDDVFGANVLPALAIGLVDGCRRTSGRTAETAPAFTVELSRGPGFAGFRSGDAVTYTGVQLNIS